MMQTRFILETLVVVAAVTAGGCKNPRYCPGNPDDDCLQMWDAPPGGCTSNDQCSAPTAVCNTPAATCVECIAPDQTGACSGSKPVCDTDNTCRGCAAHDECPSHACLPTGSCADSGDVAYVAQGGSDTVCREADPCGTLQVALGTNRPIIKVAAGLVKDTKVTTIDGRSVIIVAEHGAKLDRDGDGAIVVVQSANADVKIVDLELTGQTGTSDAAIEVLPNGGAPALSLSRVNVDGNQGSGISASGGTLTVSQSTVANNAGGGIFVTGVGTKFDITNTFIHRNGDPSTSMFGGLDLGIAVATGNRLEFNTIVDNQAAINSGGVICNVAAFAAANNIIARNFLAGVPATQTMGACTYPTSVVQNDLTGLAFVHPDPPGPFDYHLTSASTAAIDQASTTSSIDIDFDGDARPQGPQKDIGADELR